MMNENVIKHKKTKLKNSAAENTQFFFFHKFKITATYLGHSIVINDYNKCCIG